jgi:ABC-type lipopolysaccharide export system ATPase subunit
MGMLKWVSDFWNGEQDEVAPVDETSEEKTKREQRAESQEKADKAKEKRDFRIEKIKAVTAKALAVGVKRKWLVFMIVAAIAAYLIIFKGGIAGVF